VRLDDFAIVIPTRDRWSILEQTLQSLMLQASGAEIIVVVDGTDQAVPPLQAAKVVVVPKGGPGGARNAGVAETSRPLVLFLGDDMIPAPDLLERHLCRHRTEPDENVAVLGQAVWHSSVAHNPLHKWLDRASLQFDFAAIPEGDDAGWGRFYSCNVSMKRSMFCKAGGFDPDFTYYYEDLDAAWRLQKAGLVLRYEPSALTFHLHDYDEARLRARFAGVAKGERLMCSKHDWFEPWFEPRFRAARRTSPERWIWSRLDRSNWPGRPGAVIRAHADLWYLQQMGAAFLDSWDGDADLNELREYLADRYDHSLLVHHREAVDQEEAAAGDEATFYRTSEAYLYDLTAFAMSGSKTPYRDALRRFVAPGSRLLDYGCGIGSDGLRFLSDGYLVDFADFVNPSTAYLKWRLDRRGLERSVFDVEGQVPGGYEAAFSFDVIEHVDDPFAFLAELDERARIVAVNLLEPDPADTHLHKPLPIKELVRHARRRHKVVYHKLLHSRSHLLIYRV
jgi:glycosyltransferase involved in cell wall biosynthesis